MKRDSGTRCGRSDAFLSVMALDLAVSFATLGFSHIKTEEEEETVCFQPLVFVAVRQA